MRISGLIVMRISFGLLPLLLLYRVRQESLKLPSPVMHGTVKCQTQAVMPVWKGTQLKRSAILCHGVGKQQSILNRDRSIVRSMKEECGRRTSRDTVLHRQFCCQTCR